MCHVVNIPKSPFVQVFIGDKGRLPKHYVYYIVNKLTGKVYIGSGTGKRCWVHFSAKWRGHSEPSHIWRAIKRDGAENFEVWVREVTEDIKISEEQKLLDMIPRGKKGGIDKKYFYNTSTSASGGSDGVELYFINTITGEVSSCKNAVEAQCLGYGCSSHIGCKAREGSLRLSKQYLVGYSADSVSKKLIAWRSSLIVPTVIDLQDSSPKDFADLAGIDARRVSALLYGEGESRRVKVQSKKDLVWGGLEVRAGTWLTFVKSGVGNKDITTCIDFGGMSLNALVSLTGVEKSTLCCLRKGSRAKAKAKKDFSYGGVSLKAGDWFKVKL